MLLLHEDEIRGSGFKEFVCLWINQNQFLFIDIQIVEWFVKLFVYGLFVWRLSSLVSKRDAIIEQFQNEEITKEQMNEQLKPLELEI